MNRKLYVLYIEDSEEDTVLNLRLLKNAGYDVTHCRVETADEMKNVIDREPWDLVLSDFSMPRFSVQEALDIYHEHGADIPFIVISGAIGEELAVQLIKSGVHNYVLKGNMTRFLPVIERELQEADTRRELVKVSTALALSEEKFKSFIENAPDGVFVTDLTGKYVDVNAATCHITGYSREQFGRMSVRNLVPFSGDGKSGDWFGRLLETGSANETFLVHKQGVMQWLAINMIRLSEDLVIGFMKDITSSENAMREVMRAREELQRLNQHMTDARESERAAVALEIHDELGQALTAIKIDMRWVHEHMAETDKATAKITKIIEMVNETIKKVQRITAELRPGLLDDLGLAMAMEWYCGEFEQRTGISCSLTLEDLPDNDQPYNLPLFRIFQEAMTNIIRHAKAKTVQVSLSHNESGIVMTIEDDGVGMPEEMMTSGKSLGLIGMRERARQIHGTIEFSNPDGEGTKIITFIPIQNIEPHRE